MLHACKVHVIFKDKVSSLGTKIHIQDAMFARLNRPYFLLAWHAGQPAQKGALFTWRGAIVLASVLHGPWCYCYYLYDEAWW